MDLQYKTLDSSDKYIVSFHYSTVSGTPQFRLEVYETNANSAGHHIEPKRKVVCEGEAAIKAIRQCVAQCQEYTTLYDK